MKKQNNKMAAPVNYAEENRIEKARVKNLLSENPHKPVKACKYKLGVGRKNFGKLLETQFFMVHTMGQLENIFHPRKSELF